MANRHTIQKQVLEITTTDESAKLGFEREVQEIYEDMLLPKIETLFDRYGGPGSRIRAEKLEIHVTIPLSKAWREHFCDAVIRELETGLRSAVKNEIGSPEVVGFTEARTDEQEVFLYFLSNGNLPWYADPTTQPGIKEYIRRVLSGEAPSWGSLYEPKSFMNRVVRLLAAEEKAVMRWIQQIGEESLEKIFSDTPEYKIIQQWMGRLPLLPGMGLVAAGWILVFSLLARRAAAGGLKGPTAWTEAEVFGMLWSILPEKTRNQWWEEECPPTLRREILVLLGRDAEDEGMEIHEMSPPVGDRASGPTETPGQKKTESRRRLEDEGIFVDNAGLVLLHPFLAPLFTALEWWKEGRFVSPELHGRAVLLTQYLVYPGEELPEHQLLLNKVLCGYEPEETLPSVLECTEWEIAETHDLLEAVIGHWKMNGRPVFTTAENLRASFLQRTGKLSRKGSGDWLLQVEGKGYDIVLNGLPWGIGLIKHPWMPDMLRVEWGR